MSPAPKQGDLFNVNTLFIKVLHDLIKRGELREMTPGPFAILCVIRSHVPIAGTSAFPSVKLISEMTGIGRTSVFKGLKRLEDLGYLAIRKSGRKNVYELKEKFYLESNVPEEIGDQWLIGPYGPVAGREAEKDVRHFAKHGELPNGSSITISPINIVFQVSTGDGANVNVGGASLDQEQLKKLVAQVEPGYFQKEVTRILERIKTELPNVAGDAKQLGKGSSD